MFGLKYGNKGKTVIFCAATVFTALTLATAPGIARDNGGGGGGNGSGAGGSDNLRYKPQYNVPRSTSQTAVPRNTPKATVPRGQKRATKRRGSGEIKPRFRRSSKRVTRTVPTETAPSGMPPENENRYIIDEVVVRFSLGAAQSSMNQVVARANLRHVGARTFRMAGATLHRYEIVGGQPVAEVIAQLETSSAVVYAQPNYVYELAQAAKSASDLQYAFDRMKFGGLHERTKGEGVKVAVIDTGVEKDHPGFANAEIRIVDVSDGGADRVTAHGTAMAGIIGSSGAVAGIAPEAELIAIAAFSADDDGNVTGNSWTIAKAADAAFDEKARIVNMSFAGPADPLVANAMTGLAKRGAILFAASGNFGPESDTQFPAGYEEVHATTATDKSDSIYANANIGKHLAFSAPGVDILSLAPNGGYSLQTGTSVATAHLSGLAALIVAMDPDITANRVAELLQASSQDLGDPGRDPVFGFGLPDANALIAATQ